MVWCYESTNADFFRSVLCNVHTFPHITLSFQVLDQPITFDPSSTDYLQSLMMVVAIILALGFSVLVALALLLCAVISFAPPVLWPSWTYRLLTACVAGGLIAVASYSVDGAAAIHGCCHACW